MTIREKLAQDSDALVCVLQNLNSMDEPIWFRYVDALCCGECNPEFDDTGYEHFPCEVNYPDGCPYGDALELWLNAEYNEHTKKYVDLVDSH